MCKFATGHFLRKEQTCHSSGVTRLLEQKCYKYNTPIGIERYNNAKEPHSGDMFIDYLKPNNIKPRCGEMNFAIPLQIAQRN